MKYKSIVFDCDGVILNSNKIKSEAFLKIAEKYDHGAAEELLKYNQDHGGISRYHKFEYFLNVILPKYKTNSEQISVDELAEEFANEVLNRLIFCEVTPGLENLRSITHGTPWLIVSGGLQSELRQVFDAKKIASLFDVGIFGSPQSKYDIMSKQIELGNISQSSLFVGDSQLDHEVASYFGLDFIFASDWTEFSTWSEYCNKCNLKTVKMVKDIANII